MGSVSPWSYTVPAGINLTETLTYRIKVRALDQLGNLGNSEGAGEGDKTFRWDTQTPTGKVVVPSSASFQSSINTITGTAADTGGNHGRSLRIYLDTGTTVVSRAGKQASEL